VYTQCPDCATVFRVTAETLRAAQGDVRCGVCSTTFNALENLSEKAFKPAPESEAPATDDSMTVEELPGGENIELSAPVELSIVTDAPEAPAPPTAAEDEAKALEFHGDAADLDRLFVVEDAALARFDPAEVAKELSGTHPQPQVDGDAVDLDSTDEHPILVLDERDELPEEAGESIVLETREPEPDPVPPPPVPPAAPARRVPPPPAQASTGQTAPRILIPDEMRKRLAEEAASRADAARLFEPDDDAGTGLLSQRWPWAAGVAALSLLFLLQVIHASRNDLVRSPTFGPIVAGAYSAFGLSVLAPTDLTAYELHQWGAASDPNEANRLMLRASIVNRASYAQPLPLLRLTLQDLYGGTLGLRDIGPADYLPGPGGSGLLEPGQRADALIRIVDPGEAAVGFELDICLPAKGGVRCANQIKTARQ
jgi:predicted Zn finger-like uncharacterized protein